MRCNPFHDLTVGKLRRWYQNSIHREMIFTKNDSSPPTGGEAEPEAIKTRLLTDKTNILSEYGAEDLLFIRIVHLIGRLDTQRPTIVQDV